MSKKTICVDKVTPIIGRRFGTLVVKGLGSSFTKERATVIRVEYKALCECSCGATVEVPVNKLINLKDHNFCGESSKHPEHSPRRDLTNEVFGRLTVTQCTEGCEVIACVCECGKEVRVLRSNLVTGKTLSCGSPKHRIKKDDAYLNTVYSRIKRLSSDRPVGVMFSSYTVFRQWSIDNGYSSENKHLNLKSYVAGYIDGNMFWSKVKIRPSDANKILREKNKASILNRTKYLLDGVTLKQYCSDHNLNYGALSERIRNYVRRNGSITEDTIRLLIEKPVIEGVKEARAQYGDRLGMSATEFASIHHIPVTCLYDVMKNMSLDKDAILREVRTRQEERVSTIGIKKHASKYSRLLGMSLRDFCQEKQLSYAKVVSQIRANPTKDLFEVLKSCGYSDES